MRKRMRVKGIHIFVGIVILVVLAAIVVGFILVGSPANQRMLKLDEERVRDLSQIRSNIVRYWEEEQQLPEALDNLDDDFPGYTAPRDPETDEPYTYKTLGALNFSLCATFDLPTPESPASQPRPAYSNHHLLDGDSFDHGKGEQCFNWTIDEEEYERLEQSGNAPRPVPDRPIAY